MAEDDEEFASRGEGRGWVGSDGPFTVEVCASRVTCPITMCGNPGHDRKSRYVGMLGATVRYRPVRGRSTAAAVRAHGASPRTRSALAGLLREPRRSRSADVK